MSRRETLWTVHRPQAVPDGAGGQQLTMSIVAAERGDVRELAGVELVEAQQAGAEHTHSAWFRARANIRRGDELERDGVRLQVLTVSTTFPGDFRLRVTARSIEAGG